MIPEELTKLNQWVCIYNGSKVPMCAFNPLPASPTNQATWSDYATARKNLDGGCYDYLGFVLHSNGLVGIDIDTGFDEDGMLTDEALEVITMCRSYTERSRSGRGFHIFLYGDIPDNGYNNRSGMEMYKDSRYFIMTGDTVFFDKIERNQEAIDYILHKYFSSMVSQNAQKKDFGGARQYAPVWSKPEHGKIRIRPEYPAIPKGCRNVSLLSLGGALLNENYTSEQILRELIRANREACNPPLDDREVKQVLKSIERYRLCQKD